MDLIASFALFPLSRFSLRYTALAWPIRLFASRPRPPAPTPRSAPPSADLPGASPGPGPGLVRAIAQGDEQAMADLYDHYSRGVYALALRIVRQPNVAEEIVQETFVRVWRAAPSYEGGASCEGWLYRIARNMCLDQLRRQRARPEIEDTMESDSEHENPIESIADAAADVAEEAWERLRREQVRQALAALPPEQRVTLELAYFEGLTHREIAERLNEPLGTIKTRLRLGLQKLAVMFQAGA